MLHEILKYRDLLWMLTLRDIKIRYKQAAMGFLWALFMPVIGVFAGLLIKKAMAVMANLPMNAEGILSITVKVLPWTFFINSIKFSVQALVGNANLVSKIYFPRAVLPLSAILACLFDFIIAIGGAAIVLACFHIGASLELLWLPLILLFLILFTSGLGMLLASANLFFRDVKYIVEVILMFGIFFTPVFYDVSGFGKWRTLLLLNPIGSILEAINATVVLHVAPDFHWLGYAGVSSILMFILGLQVFQKNEPLFAENI